MTLPVRAAALVVAAASLSCARQGSPSGGPPDVLPPVVIATDPAPNSLVEDLGVVISFRFSERVSERPARGIMNDAVMVSPRAGPVRVEPGRELIEVRVDGGFRTGIVYRITLLPVITDLFGNAMREPFELVLTTGAPSSRTLWLARFWTALRGSPSRRSKSHWCPSRPCSTPSFTCPGATGPGCSSSGTFRPGGTT